MDLSSALLATAQGIARYASQRLSAEGKLGAREFYAHAFSVWLFAQLGSEFDPARLQALECIRINGDHVSDHHPTKFHWEFVRFALQQADELGGLGPYSSVRDLLGKEKFALVRVANWTLLRTSVRLLSCSPFQRTLSHIERSLALKWFQKKGGFIEDQRSAPTAQYHAFSTSMLGVQIMQSSIASKIHRKEFLAAIAALERITFPSGEMNIIGRGSLQSFGYASAILAYSIAFKITGERKYLNLVSLVYGRLQREVRSDGTIPLQMSGLETDRGGLVDLNDPAYSGWYMYNNYFDYLMFSGALIAFASKIIGKGSLPTEEAANGVFKSDDIKGGIRVVRTKGYSALCSPPSTGLTDHMAIPFVEVNGSWPLPCYGGDTFPNHRYRLEGMPLPLVLGPNGEKQVLFRRRAYRWHSSTAFTGRGPGWRVVRSIEFSDTGFVVTDRITLSSRFDGWRLRCTRFLLKPNAVQIDENTVTSDGVVVKSTRRLYPEEQLQCGPQGDLVAYSSDVTVESGGRIFSDSVEFRFTV